MMTTFIYVAMDRLNTHICD